MQSQAPQSKTLNLQQTKTSGMVARLEGWHETYTRLNPWAHGGLIERVIQKFSSVEAPFENHALFQNRNSDVPHKRLTKVTKDKASTVLRSRVDAY